MRQHPKALHPPASRSGHGGARQGAGRPALDLFGPQVRWVVQRVREELKTTEQARMKRWLRKHHHAAPVDAFEEIEGHWETLRTMPVLQRAAIIADPVGTALEDVQAEFDAVNLPRIARIPPPSQFDMAGAYVRTAKAASAHLGRKITPRQVKDCMARWNALERAIAPEPT